MISNRLDELLVSISLLDRQHEFLDDACASARLEVERAERTGMRVDLERANAIAESARIALEKCDNEIQRLKRQVAALQAANDGT